MIKDITIPPEALEAAARAHAKMNEGHDEWWFLHVDKVRAACLAMLRAWPVEQGEDVARAALPILPLSALSSLDEDCEAAECALSEYDETGGVTLEHLKAEVNISLRAEVERLTARIRELEDANAQLQEIVNGDTAEEERLRAENEKLWVAVKEVVNEAAKHHAENLSRAKLGGSDMAQRKAKAIVARSGVLFHNIKAIARAALGEKP